MTHYVTFVSLLPSKRVLPSGGTLVPELVVGQGPGRVVVTDSEAILRWLDDNRGTKLFPTEQAAELSGRASNGVCSLDAKHHLVYDGAIGDHDARFWDSDDEALVFPDGVPAASCTRALRVLSTEGNLLHTY